ncbi:hypothetical protein D3C76_943550 [compost metagenome]
MAAGGVLSALQAAFDHPLAEGMKLDLLCILFGKNAHLGAVRVVPGSGPLPPVLAYPPNLLLQCFKTAVLLKGNTGLFTVAVEIGP